MTGDKLDGEAIHTAHFLEMFDKLFNTFNSSKLHDSHKLRRAISPTSDHVSFLKDTLKWLVNVTPVGKASTLPCLKGWKLYINSLLGLWEDVHISYRLQFLLTNRLNQDCLENYFSLVRGRGGHLDNPMLFNLWLSFAYALEMVFRQHVTRAVHNPNFRLRYVESIKTEHDVFLVVCGDTDCQKSHMYIVNLYFTVRIHNLLKEQNRSLQILGVKRNGKVMTLLHV